jgi:TatD DNase family protein
MVTIGTRLGEQAATVRGIADRHEGVFATVGIHPTMPARARLRPWRPSCGRRTTRAWSGLAKAGSTISTTRRRATGSRRVSVATSPPPARSGLPLVVHARDADADIAAILEDEDARGKFPFLLHCFSSGAELARRAVRLGSYISFSGMLTFPKSDSIRAVAAETPAERLLVETDSPYLAPVPMRGRPCEPALVVHTAAKLAQVRGLGMAELADLTTGNFHRLFSRAA